MNVGEGFRYDYGLIYLVLEALRFYGLLSIWILHWVSRSNQFRRGAAASAFFLDRR